MSIAAIAAAIDAQLGGSFAPPYTKSDIQTRVATALYSSLQVGVANNTAAATGEIGEVLRITRTFSSATTLTAGTPVDICTTTSLTLTPGDWSVQGMVGFKTGASTAFTVLVGGISKTSATLPGVDTVAVPTSGEVRTEFDISTTAAGAGSALTLTIPPYRVLVPAATTLQLFLIGQSGFTSSAPSIYGSMEARRMR